MVSPRAALCWAMLMASLAAGVAQAPPAPGEARAADDAAALPPRPNDGILDEARLLSAAQRTAMAAEVQRLGRESDVELFVAAYTLLNEGVQDRARRLRREWASGDRCIVALYRRGEKNLTFSVSDELTSIVPTAQLHEVYQKAAAAAAGREEPREQLVLAIQTFADEFTAVLKRREADANPFGLSKLAVVGGVFAVALLILGAGYWTNERLTRKKAERDARSLFPEVVVGTRLGAPFGGGTVAEIEFRPAPGQAPPPAAAPSAAAPSHPAPRA